MMTNDCKFKVITLILDHDLYDNIIRFSVKDEITVDKFIKHCIEERISLELLREDSK